MSFKALQAALSIPRYQWRNQPILLSEKECTGKTYIITGANSGLGLESVKHLVRFGAKKVVCACRSASRGDTAVKQVEAETGVHGVAELWLLDMSSRKSCVAFAERSRRELNEIEAVVLNATAANKDWILSDGWESSLAVNAINTVFLTLLMMPQLSESAEKTGIKPRVQIVTSGLAFEAKADLDKVDPSTILRDFNTEARFPIRGVSRYDNRMSLTQIVLLTLVQIQSVETRPSLLH